ncbi:DUF1430 domain-containing protein [Enterococcus faecium]|uniref:DUF1430 domain-containing protein n=1 Tax=Enterococcus faecium TaxID=1352 RepID=UPI00210139B5|nr:DUF1430 domain-containing protein [Enterococcus faecium]UTU61244.1 DUF1430 domain-containing protein [Enterococcus faecium]
MSGFALVSINKQVLYRTNEFFHQTDTYTPIRLPQHFIGQEEYEQLIMVFENVSSETELSYMKKTVNESNEVDTSWNFKIQPKLEMTLYYQGDVKSSHEKVPYSNTSFRVTSIEESIKIKDFEGEFFLMTREKEAYERFISLFTDRFNQAFHTDYATNIFEDFENSYSYSVISNTDVYNYRVYLTIGLILLFLLLSSFFLLMNKEISLLLNNDFSLHQVLWCLLGKKKIIITFIIAGIIGGFIFMYYKEQFLYLFQMYVFLFSGIYGISLISLLLVEKIASLREAFNYIQYILFTFGLLFSLLLTVANVELATIVFSSSQLAVSHEPPKEIAGEDYHVFYPVTIGKNHVDFIYSNRFASAADQELYETLNKNGSILVNVSDYLNEENEQFGRGIKINLNYLKKFPLIDVSGRLIQITEKETKFLFIKNNQPIYTFIPSIPWIEHYPVVEILTLKNSTYLERNILSGEIYPPLKIKIGSLSKERLFELIEESQLRDNLQLSFPYTQTEEIAVKVLSRSFHYLIQIFLLTFFSFFLLSYVMLCIYFVYNCRKIAIFRSSGYSLFETYKDFFMMNLIKWGTTSVIFLFLIEREPKYLFNIFFFSFIDFILSVVFILSTEKKSQLLLMNGG